MLKDYKKQNNYRRFKKENAPGSNNGKKIFKDDDKKKADLDKDIRSAINKDFSAMLKKDKFEDNDQKAIYQYVKNFIQSNGYFFTDKSDEEIFITSIVNDIFGFGTIQQLIVDPKVQEIWVEGRRGIFYEQEGKIIQSELKFRGEMPIFSLANKILAPINRKADETNPTVDARLPDGSRVAITLPPVALNGPTINIRKFKKDKFTLDDYVRIGSASPEMKEFLTWSVRAGLNIIIAGGTGSGKTTLLNALSNEIPADRGLEHIITIEDSAELQLYQTFVTSWETKAANSEGQGAVDSSQLLKHALRNAPTRIILGEMRDKVAYDVLQAVNTGHDGTMSTIHCENSAAAIRRFADLAASSGIISTEEATRSIGDSFDLVVFVEKFWDERDKKTYRKITQITYIAGTGTQGASRIKLKNLDKADPNKVYLQDLFDYDKRNHTFVCSGFFPTELDNKLKAKKYQYPDGLFKQRKE
jgi:pilus assembly protein CpaF